MLPASVEVSSALKPIRGELSESSKKRRRPASTAKSFKGVPMMGTLNELNDSNEAIDDDATSTPKRVRGVFDETDSESDMEVDSEQSDGDN
jgi:hypothetical protein